MRPQVDSFGDARHRLAPDEMSMPAGKIALGIVFKSPPQEVGNYKTEDAVAKEFETLVAAPDKLSTPTAAFGDRPLTFASYSRE